MAPIKGDDGFSGIAVPSPGTFGALGDSAASHGVVGLSGGPAGVYGESNLPFRGNDSGGAGVLGVNMAQGGNGVRGRGGLIGVQGEGQAGVIGRGSQTGVIGDGPIFGTIGRSSNVGAYAYNSTAGLSAYLATGKYAAEFYNDIYVNGVVNKTAVGFIIDHPLDPANRYLRHGGVESSEWKNIYDGIAVLDGQGEAEVELPAWFGALNKHFRYQLTCVGGHAPVFVSRKIEDNRFRIGGGTPGLEVAWQVTGVRQDAWAKANPLHPDQEKPKAERGSFLHPELHGAPQEKGVRYVRHPEPQTATTGE